MDIKISETIYQEISKGLYVPLESTHFFLDNSKGPVSVSTKEDILPL